MSELASMVAGVYMNRSIVDFQRACEVYIAEEQRKANPDTALIALLCDAVRCSRELAIVAPVFYDSYVKPGDRKEPTRE